ncbi:hypothetical protein CEXT_105601 [Caerostris extrusa]|uniref:PEP-CTERM sorting domain-containing protein n=1 Tax=Caerostris extrusa TaxID=172846 RepID=A0AAV4PZ44_CAEEX|nr:hypothetical protein CEXT_105601 [Caerostris extrusa]
MCPFDTISYLGGEGKGKILEHGHKTVCFCYLVRILIRTSSVKAEVPVFQETQRPELMIAVLFVIGLFAVRKKKNFSVKAEVPVVQENTTTRVNDYRSFVTELLALKKVIRSVFSNWVALLLSF